MNRSRPSARPINDTAVVQRLTPKTYTANGLAISIRPPFLRANPSRTLDFIGDPALVYILNTFLSFSLTAWTNTYAITLYGKCPRGA